MRPVARARWKPWLILLAVPVILVVAAVSYFAWRQSVPGVRAELRPAPKFLGVKTPLAVDLKAARGGVASVEVKVVQGTTSAVVAQQAFAAPPAAEQHVDLAVAGRDLGLRDGPATIEVRARDGFWRPFRPRRPARPQRPGHDQVHAADARGARRHALPAPGRRRPRRAARQGRIAGRRQGRRRLLPRLPRRAGRGRPRASRSSPCPGISPTRRRSPPGPRTRRAIRVSRPLPSELKPRRFPSGTVEISDRFLAAKLPELLPERPSIPPEQQVPALPRRQPGQAQGGRGHQAPGRHPHAAAPALARRLHPAAQYQGLLELRGDALLPLRRQGDRHPGAPGLRPGLAQEQPRARGQFRRRRLRGPAHHLRQHGDRRSRARAADALRPPLEPRRQGRRRGQAGPGARVERAPPAWPSAITCTSRS